MNLLLKIKGWGGGGAGGVSRPNFVSFVVWSALFIGNHSMQGWTTTTGHEVTKKKHMKIKVQEISLKIICN